MNNALDYQLNMLLLQSQQIHNVGMAISDAMEYAPTSPGTYCESVKLLVKLLEEHSAKIYQMVEMAEEM